MKIVMATVFVVLVALACSPLLLLSGCGHVNKPLDGHERVWLYWPDGTPAAIVQAEQDTWALPTPRELTITSGTLTYRSAADNTAARATWGLTWREIVALAVGAFAGGL